MEGDHLPDTGREKKEGDFGNEHKIPFLVVRKQTVAVNFQKATHRKLEVGINQLQLGFVGSFGALGADAFDLPEDLGKTVD